MTSHVISKFQSIMSSPKRAPLEFNSDLGKLLGLDNPDIPPESLTFDSWSPNPWTVVGGNGANLVSFSNIGLTITKASLVSGAVTIYEFLKLNITSDGWTTKSPSLPETSAFLRLDFANAQGGLILSTRFPISVECGMNKQQILSSALLIDVFDLIKGAHISLEETTFYRC